MIKYNFQESEVETKKEKKRKKKNAKKAEEEERKESDKENLKEEGEAEEEEEERKIDDDDDEVVPNMGDGDGEDIVVSGANTRLKIPNRFTVYKIRRRSVEMKRTVVFWKHI